ncbi:MAG: long-chain fatty acid--CoA ligase [Mariprofundaceae bacterium]|nr:long-chain fatty acid--CoA ligase [Mariprofundaceae bacterium]
MTDYSEASNVETNGSEGNCPGGNMAREAGCLSDLLLESPDAWADSPMLGCREDDAWHWLTRAEVQQKVRRVASWLYSTGVRPGDRVGLLGHNSPEWCIADFAVLRIGAVTVPAYFTDPPEAVQYVFEDAGCKLILVEPGEQQAKLDASKAPVFTFKDGTSGGVERITLDGISRDTSFDGEINVEKPKRDDVATLIYTSGTTGNPKGVMLTHGNLLSDVTAELAVIPVFPDDVFLSFLPLSHAFERNVGQFLPVACGTRIAYAEDITTLMRDIPEVKPTVMISVPRLYEKIYAGVHEKLSHAPAIKRKLFDKAQALGAENFELKQEGSSLSGGKAIVFKVLDHIVHGKLRTKLGGRLRLFISGGAALHPDIARFLLAAGITVCPGYGLSETSPVITVNPEQKIKPETVGPALPSVELKVGEDGELLARGPMIMRGYWNKPEETAQVLDKDGWLHTGDLVEMDADGYVRIVDRKKELMVLSNGENVPPARVEKRLAIDACVLQAMVVGDQRPNITALVVPEAAQLGAVWSRERKRPLPENWRENADVHQWLLERMHRQCHELPSFMQVKNFVFVEEEWTQAEGMLTPTLKFKRRKVMARHQEEIDAMYEEESTTA